MESSLPNGWVELTLKELTEFRKGKKPKTLCPHEFQDSVPYLDIKTIEKGMVGQYADRATSNVTNENELLVVWDGARSGWVGKATHGAIGSTLMALKPKGINKEYLFRFLQTQFKYINSNPRGTGIPHVDPEVFWNIRVPLPPLNEQKRIVAKMDSLLERVAASKIRLDQIPILLKNFRRSVLTAAVSGKLTESLRDCNESLKLGTPITIGNVYQETIGKWKWEWLIDIAKLESGHTPRKSKVEYWEKGEVPWISLQDIRAAHGSTIVDTRYKPNNVGINNSSARILPEGTVVFSRDISPGYTTIMGKPMATSQHFANWICSDKILNRYLLYAFMAAGKHLVASGEGTTVTTLYMPEIKKFRILLPPLNEQKEIVRIVDELFHYGESIEARYQKAKAWFDKIPQAILAKAFRGELVPQDEKDEPVSVLVERIKTEKTSSIKKKQNRKHVKAL